ncbi:MAG: class I SAM-dependent methyltransferase [Acidobacteriota bacterium]
MSRLQTRAEQMMHDHGFLGVPLETFESSSRRHFVRLLELGLSPESKVLDIGCGCLRVGYWLIRFLDPDGYCGIEPSRQRVELGRRYLFSTAELDAKRPRFAYRADFDTSVFTSRFDVFFACSIWTHCGKVAIERMLDGFVDDTGPDGTFLVSYLPATSADDDYQGSEWVGTSHESTTPGIVRHDPSWLRQACDDRRLSVDELPGVDSESQSWLRLTKR